MDAASDHRSGAVPRDKLPKAHRCYPGEIGTIGMVSTTLLASPNIRKGNPGANVMTAVVGHLKAK